MKYEFRRFTTVAVAAALVAWAGAAHAQLYRQSDLLSRSVRLAPPPAAAFFTKQSVPMAEQGWAFGAKADAVIDIGSEDDRAVIVPFALGWQKELADVTWTIGLDSNGFVHAWSPESKSGLSDLRLSGGGTWKVGQGATLTPALTLVIPTRSDFGSDDAALALGLAYARSFGRTFGLGATYQYTRVDAPGTEPGSRLQSGSLSLDAELIPNSPFTMIVGRDLARALPGTTSVYLQQTLPWKPLSEKLTTYFFFRWARSAGESVHGAGAGISYAFN